MGCLQGATSKTRTFQILNCKYTYIRLYRKSLQIKIKKVFKIEYVNKKILLFKTFRSWSVTRDYRCEDRNEFAS